jgi:hypothetical protein
MTDFAAVQKTPNLGYDIVGGPASFLVNDEDPFQSASLVDCDVCPIHILKIP